MVSNKITRRYVLLLVVFFNYSSGYKSFLPNQISSSHAKFNDFSSQFGHIRRTDCSLRLAAEPQTERFGTGIRLLLSGVAITGSAETAFLTYSKLTSSSLGNFCSSPESCSNVLDGPYSTIPLLNVPLSAVAFLGYTVIALLSVAPLFNKDADTSETRSVILFTSSGMAAFSLYLMALLAFVIQTPCNFCYLSAALSFSMAGITLTQKAVENPTKSFLISSSSAIISFIASIFLFYTTSTLIKNSALADSQPVSASAAAVIADATPIDKKPPQEAPKIKNNSSPRAMLIGGRLQALNAKMYGAFWCSHCNNQKQELGIEASKLFEYVECAKDGVNSQFSVCKDEKIPGFPTWQINGELYPGEKDLPELEKLLTEIEKKIVQN